METGEPKPEDDAASDYDDAGDGADEIDYAELTAEEKVEKKAELEEQKQAAEAVAAAAAAGSEELSGARATVDAIDVQLEALEAVMEPEGPKVRRFSLEALPFVTDAQQQHGLRHQDYERYRRYCSQRLKRIRKSLNFTQGRKSHVRKVITSETVKDVRYLHIPLVQAERAWAYYMQLKGESEEVERRKFHKLSRLKKAAKHAEELRELVGTEGVLCDERTQLEVTAYAAFLQATASVEMRQWDTAIKQFLDARDISEGLGAASTEANRPIYLARVEEINAQLRLCTFYRDGDGDIEQLAKDASRSTAMTNLLEMFEKAKLEQQQGEEAAAADKQVSWCGRTVSMRNEKLRLVMLRVADREKQLAEGEGKTDAEAANTIYDQLYGDYDGGIGIIAGDIVAAQKKGGEEAAVEVNELEFLRDFMTFSRLEKSMERTLRWIDDKQREIKAGEAKPEDLVRLYDITVESLESMRELEPLQDDVSWLKYAKGREGGSKALRCFCIAETHLGAKRYQEAWVLYDQVSKYARAAQSELAASSANTKALEEELTAILALLRGRKCVITSQAFLQSQETESAAAAAAGGAGAADTRPLASNMESYEAGSKIEPGKGGLVAFPPDFKSMPCKPLYFDLAGNYLEYPSLEARIAEMEAEQQTSLGAAAGMLTGAVGGALGKLGGWWGGNG